MTIRAWGNLFLLAVLAAIVAACWSLAGRDFRQPNYNFVPEAQMVYSPAYDTFAPNPNFSDGSTLRTPPAGTIARGHLPFHYDATPQDALRAGRELQNPFSEANESRQERGSFVYAQYCQVCHGPLGQGNGPVTQHGFPSPASLLADRAVQMRDGQMFHVLTYGQGNMPAFSSRLSRVDRWNVILYVRLLQGPPPSAGPSRSEQVARLFGENCAACHGLDGTGNNIRKVLPLIPDFTSLAWQMSQTEMAIVNQIDYGSHPLMPSFRYKLTNDDILRLAVYVRSFGGRQGSTSAISPGPTSHITAANVYGTYCFACHDTTGKGNPAMRLPMPEIPNFTLSSWQKSRTDADLANSILHGKGKFMLPMTDKLGSVDVKQMVALVRKFDGGKQVIPLQPPKAPGPPAPMVVTAPTAILPGPGGAQAPVVEEPLVAASGDLAARIRVGASIFQQFCIVCHGPDGTGSIMRPRMPPIPDFTSPAFQDSHSDARIQISILDGKGTLMPANRGRVTEEQAEDLMNFIRAFGPKRSVAARTQPSDTRFDKEFRRLEEQWNALEKQLQQK